MSSKPPASNGPQLMNVGSARVLCCADVRGNISLLNQLAEETRADYIIHCGDFGFYEKASVGRMSDRTLKHILQYSTLIPPHIRARLNSATPDDARRTISESNTPYLSEFPQFLAGEKRLRVPVYCVWGACEDVTVVERMKAGEYKVENLNLIDEGALLEIGGVGLRLFGLGGAFVPQKLFDHGEGHGSIAGGSGTMWVTALQIGELVEQAQRLYNPSETRMLVTHASPGREGLIAQLSLVLRADFTLSASLHFRYGISYNEFSVQPDQDHFRNRLIQAQRTILQVWDRVKSEVESSITERQRALIQHFMTVVNRLPPTGRDGTEKDEQAFKNTWHFNMPDAAFGWLALEVSNGRMVAESKAQGFNFSYRRKPKKESTSASWRGENALGAPSGGDGDNKESWRDSRRQSTTHNQFTVYISGLLHTPVSEEDIRGFFGPVAAGIGRVRLLYDRHSQQQRASCFVDFTNQAAFDEALRMDGQRLGENTLNIKKADPNRGLDARRGGRGGGRSGSRGGHRPNPPSRHSTSSSLTEGNRR
ncbi:uncharacterized protein VTP21DRAFT_11703 [Calcarisporiella thermophila]|uniref:uncharacterized protein n=1 Tax=Calcarisporiella thermophila TaxID=911321 RepID=UPI003743421A